MSPAQFTNVVSQESFNSRLKAEGDDASTNLYISNLPKHMNEMVSSLDDCVGSSGFDRDPELIWTGTITIGTWVHLCWLYHSVKQDFAR